MNTGTLNVTVKILLCSKTFFQKCTLQFTKNCNRITGSVSFFLGKVKYSLEANSIKYIHTVFTINSSSETEKNQQSIEKNQQSIIKYSVKKKNYFVL